MTRSEIGYAIAAVAANLAGALVVTAGVGWGVKAVDAMLSLAAGFMISVALVDMVPEAIEVGGADAALIVLVGYLLVHLTQHTIARHFHFGEETHEVSEIVSVSALVGLLLHTFVDGVAVATSTRVSPALGAMVFTSVALHKIPEGLAISSLFLAAGASRRRALAAAGALGAATLAGIVVTGYVDGLANYGLALSAGVTLYVGASNLVPEFQSKPGWRNPLFFFAGCGIYAVARALIGGH